MTPKHKSQHKEKTLLVAVVTTAISLIPTAYAAIASNSIVLFADFLRCAAEFLAIFLSWLVLRKLSKADKSYYDYGFGKLEQLASMSVSFAMLISFAIIGALAINRLYNPIQVENALFGFVLGVLSVAGNVFMWLHNRNLAKVERSPILESQAQLFRAKSIASIIVVVSLSLVLSNLSADWVYYADPIGSLGLCVLLLYSAVTLLFSSMQDLLDRSVEEAMRLVILRVLVKHEANYVGLSNIRTRRAGNKIFIELALEFPEEMKLGELSSISEAIKTDISAEIPLSEVVIVPVKA